MNLQLLDKPVIVCASSAGLGRATALEFAREGARVMLCGRRSDVLREVAAQIKAATDNEPRYTVADLTRAADVSGLIDATVDAFGGVFTVINNAGGPPAGSFGDFDDAAWQSAFELNLLSCVRVTRAALPQLRKGGGRIVNFTSTSVRAPIDNLILSNTFRTAVLGLSKSLANELGSAGILVNVVGPGRVQTERIQQLDTLRANKAGVSIEQIQRDTCKAIPLGRYGVAEELARAAVFLGSPANSYITGQTLLVDGGMVRAY